MRSDTTRGRWTRGLALAATAVLLVAAVAVRGLEAGPLPRPDEGGEDAHALREPLQFLARGASLRVAELDRWIAPERRGNWRSTRGVLYRIGDCPELTEWLDGVEGLRFERLVAELRDGTREEALASLALLFELARSSEWSPGPLDGSAGAERLGGLLAEWLRVRADEAATDPLLYEPALAAALLYGRVLRLAARAPLMGRNQAALARGRTFLRALCGAGLAGRTPFGTALAARHGRALALLDGEDDPLAGFAEESRAQFPGLDGDCEGR